MPIEYEIDGDFAVVTCEGEFTMDNVREIVDWVNTEPTLPERIKLLIIDRSTTFDPSTMELEEVAAIYATVRERISSRWALVVSKQYHYGLARMYSVFAERYGLDARVFTSADEARAWLDGEVPAGDAHRPTENIE